MSADYTLAAGSHTTPAEGRCAMEWVVKLQASALDLFDRMLPTEIIDLDAPVIERAIAVCGVTS